MGDVVSDDVVHGDEEQMVAIEDASAGAAIEQPESQMGDIEQLEEQNAVIPAAEENIAAKDLSEVSIVEDAIVMADVPSEDYQMPARGDAAAVMENASTEEISVGGIEEEAVPVLAPRPALTEKQDKSAEGFQQTEEVPAEVIVSDVNEDDYDSLRQAAFSFSKNGGFQSFQADEKQYNLILEDIDFAVHELSNWSLIIFDDYRLRLNSAEKELVVPKADNIVRFAKILKGGKTKLELFNEERYNFMTPGEEFVKVRGHCIYGNIANNSKLIVKDFINLSLDDKAGKVISFNKPVSGLLTGPKAAKLYFCDIRAVVIPSSARVLQDADKELSRAARWYSGSSADDCFEFDAKTPSTEFTGTDICKIIHVNVGISHYGWNITFANGLFMSFRDLQEYQTRYGQLPDHSGVISHGQQTLKFDKIEKIVIYEAPQYFTYG